MTERNLNIDERKKEENEMTMIVMPESTEELTDRTLMKLADTFQDIAKERDEFEKIMESNGSLTKFGLDLNDWRMNEDYDDIKMEYKRAKEELAVYFSKRNNE